MAIFAKAFDMTMDGSGSRLIIRSKRYTMLVEDGVVKELNVEAVPGNAETSEHRQSVEADVMSSSQARGEQADRRDFGPLMAFPHLM